MYFNYYAIPNIICAAFLLFIGYYVFRKKCDKNALIFFLLTITAAVWQAGTALILLSNDPHIAFMWIKLTYIGPVFIPVVLLHFVSTLLGKRKVDAYIKYLYIIVTIIFMLLIKMNVLLNGVNHYSWGIWYKATIYHPLFILYYYGLFFVSILFLLSAYKSVAAKTKQQIKYLLLSFLVATGGGIDYIADYGINIYPAGYLFVIICVTIIVYTITKHHLMDINVVIRKGMVYSLLAGVLSALYLSVVFLFGNYLGGRGSATSIIFTIFSIILFSFIFQPLRDRVQDFIDKVFFRGKYDYQKTLKELSLAAGSIADLDELLKKVLSSIVSVIHIKNASVYVLDKRAGQYFARRTIGIEIQSTIPENDDVIRLLALRTEAVIYDEASKTQANVGSFMQEIGAAIIFPIITKEELVGLLCLGEKLSGEVYSDEDINLLTTLSNQMGVSIENATLYEDALEAQKKLYQADKLATVGALAAGFAHEIKNPIAAIKGFSQVIDQAIIDKDSEAIKDFKDVVPRQLDRINEIVEKLLTLSKPPKMEMKKSDINALLDEIIKLVEKQAMKQKVEIFRSFGELPKTLADPEQLTQAFINLILNATQSMPEGGRVEIRTSLIDRDKIELEFIDNGVGISKEKLTKIFDPFFTTRSGGTGLGLSVTRQIIINHHGKIAVQSEIGKGTKFKVILPVK